MVGIRKEFPGLVALDDVNLELAPGEILALLGENGAGKTTLMNILFGIISPDGGQIYINGHHAKITSSRDAMKYGIGMVHQHFMLVDTLTGIENIALAHQGSSILKPGAISKKADEISRLYGLKVDLDSFVWQLSAGEQQKVEIIKAIYGDAQILILDEPTSILPPQEVEGLFTVLLSMRKQGKSIIMITHKLHEALTISDRITILRKGRIAGSLPRQNATESELVVMMVGESVPRPRTKLPRSELPPVPLLKVENLVVNNDKGSRAVDHVSFVVRRGEILGIAGIAGNGQKEIAESLVGVRKVEHGSIAFGGEEITNHGTKEIMRRGVGFIPEDKIGQGIFQDLSVSENLLITNEDDPRFLRWLIMNYASFDRIARRFAKEFNVVAPDLNAPARHLSGGNLQKLLIARTAIREAQAMIMLNPTSGLDVASVSVVHDWILQMKSGNVAIVMISEDLDEILQLSDRVIVFRAGRISGSFSGRIDLHDIAMCMMADSSQGVDVSPVIDN